MKRMIFLLITTALLLPSAAQAKDAAPAELDVAAMFWTAGPVVKGVMLALLLASMVSWALFAVKLRDIAAGARQIAQADRTLRATRRLEDIPADTPVTGAMAQAALDEIARSSALIAQGRIDGVRDRIEDSIARLEIGAAVDMRRGLPLFASVGSVGPFVGLFGTVWGIMHSFAGIAGAQSTSLAVVAPGIAEALLATALGLVAAIPATIMYNLLGRRISGYKRLLEDHATQVTNLVGRQVEMTALDNGAALPTPGAAAQQAWGR